MISITSSNTGSMRGSGFFCKGAERVQSRAGDHFWLVQQRRDRPRDTLWNCSTDFEALLRVGVDAVEPDSSGFSAEGGSRPGVCAGFGGWRPPFLSYVSRVHAAPAALAGSAEPGEPG